MSGEVNKDLMSVQTELQDLGLKLHVNWFHSPGLNDLKKEPGNG